MSSRRGRKYGYVEPEQADEPDMDLDDEPRVTWTNPSVNAHGLLRTAEAIEASLLTDVGPNHFDDALDMQRQQIGALLAELGRREYIEPLDEWQRSLYRVPESFSADAVREDIESGRIKERGSDP